MKNPNPRTKLTSLLAATCLTLAPAALAVTPPPDGGYANKNTAEGEDALFRLTNGTDNTALGYHALYGNTTGFRNTAVGSLALAMGPSGAANVAVGDAALENNAGAYNTAVGSGALVSNTTGLDNIGIGSGALLYNTTGSDNIAIGTFIFSYNQTSNFNIAMGTNTLNLHGSGDANIAIGHFAMVNDNTGQNNVAIGYNALHNSKTGINNTAIGHSALFDTSTGDNNIGIGIFAGRDLGTGSNNIDIANVGVANESKTIRIGTKATHRATYIAGISGATVAGGVGVVVDASGHLGTFTSSARYKDQIKAMDKSSEAILALKPVTFRYKKELDSLGIPQFGLVAEQVEKVNPDLVARDEQGKPYTVRYEAVNAMLLNEFLKEHRKVADQSDQIAELRATVAELKSALKAQAAQIQKVSARLAGGEAVPHVVASD